MLSEKFRWLRLILIAAIGLGILSAACGPAPTPEVVEKVVKETVVVEKEVTKVIEVTPVSTPLPMGGELIVGCNAEPETADPHTERGSTCGFLSAIYDNLIVKSADGKYLPSLATSWEISDDGLHYTFKLRQDVKFHDGTPFNAEAVCFNFDRIVDPATGSLYAVQFVGPYESCQVVDEYTARVNLKESFGPFFEGLALPYLGMVSPTAVKKYGAEFRMNQVGTGPFRWVEYALKDHMTLESNPDYNWAPETAQHQGPSYIDRITIRFVPEPATRVGIVETGEVHIVNDVPSRDAARLGTNHDLVLYNNDIPARARHYTLNLAKPPTDDPKVRKAVNMAVDRQTIVNTLYQGLWPASYNQFGPRLLFFDQSIEDKYASEYAYDPEKAGALLDEAGWKMGSDGIRYKDGQPLKVIMISSSMKEVHELVQAQLREAGIVMDIEMRAVTDFFAGCGAGEANLCWLGGRVSPDPGLVMSGFFKRGGKYDWTRHQNAHLDELLDMGAKAWDPADRQKIYSEVQDILMADALILPIFWPKELYVTRAEVKGLTFDNTEHYPLYYDVYLSK